MDKQIKTNSWKSIMNLE